MRSDSIKKAMEIFDQIDHSKYPKVSNDSGWYGPRPELTWQGPAYPLDHNVEELRQEKMRDELYNEFKTRITENKNSFSWVNFTEVNELMEEIEKRNQYHTSGLFLSAFLNATPLNCLDGVFNSDFIGWRLAPNKRLIVKEGSTSCFVGTFSQGEIINYADLYDFDLAMTCQCPTYVNHMSSLGSKMIGGRITNYGCFNSIGDEASGGVVINKGCAMYMARAGGGHQINFGEVSEMGYCSNGGMQVNFGHIGPRVRHANFWGDGIRLNYGTFESGFGIDCDGGAHINFGRTDLNCRLMGDQGYVGIGIGTGGWWNGAICPSDTPQSGACYSDPIQIVLPFPSNNPDNKKGTHEYGDLRDIVYELYNLKDLSSDTARVVDKIVGMNYQQLSHDIRQTQLNQRYNLLQNGKL